MSNGIFIIQKDGKLIEMNPQDYDSENILQELLQKYPDLLAGNQIDELNPRKWILISREVSIPDEEYAGGRWSLDHLFIDQEGIPTLVEVKRSSDTRIRREVVGQMLDYASNAVSHWNVEFLKSQYETICEKNGDEPETNLQLKLGSDINYDEFWEKVEVNLNAGKIRLLFVADKIPYELKRIVEFLNEQMNPAEVLAIEIKQYAGGEQKTLVPKVIGSTSKAQKKKSSRQSKKWDEKSFISKIQEDYTSVELNIVKYILDWIKKRNLRIWWGEGARSGSCFPMFNYNGTGYVMFAMWTYGGIEIQFQHMKNKAPYDDLQKRIELLNELNSIPNVNLPQDSIDRRPSIKYEALRDEQNLNKFLEIWDKFIENIKKGSIDN